MSKLAVAYVRVSREDLNEENQKQKIEEWARNHGFDKVIFFADEITGASRVEERHGFLSMLNFLSVNKDVEDIIFFDITRLGRDMAENLRIIKNLLEPDKREGVFQILGDKKFRLHFIQQEFLNSINDESFRNLLYAILSWFAEYERKMLIIRTKAGLERARAEGKKLGRPEKLDKAKQLLVRRLFEKGVSISSIAKILGVSRTTIYRYLKKMGIDPKSKKRGQ